MLKLLLEVGTNPNNKYDVPIPLVSAGYYNEYYDTNGITPLICALHYDRFMDNVHSFEGDDDSDGSMYYEFIKVLLENDADPDIQEDDKKQTPLMIAVDQDKPDIVLLLLENGADPNIKNNYCESAYDIALDRAAYDLTLDKRYI